MNLLRALASATLLLTAAPALAQGELRPKEVSGPAQIIDGDTIKVGFAVVRLWGVDAPEISNCTSPTVFMKPFCGTPQAEESRTSLQRIINNRDVRCVEVNRDSFGQMMGECFIGRTNIGVEQVRSGNAVGWPSYLRQNDEKAVPFLAAEAEAKAAKRGVW